eukprot:TRINITY_DN1363_c0_g2_i3.p1 TRINITY_DN1363_c0_g2~~TRINITY_DN1363_c0_g2_i3.p1  ORF type:complete len:714 (+),score=37.30 TRINITY_DN1363_c0_g2_i3:133-2274(+)
MHIIILHMILWYAFMCAQRNVLYYKYNIFIYSSYFFFSLNTIIFANSNPKNISGILSDIFSFLYVQNIYLIYVLYSFYVPPLCNVYNELRLVVGVGLLEGLAIQKLQDILCCIWRYRSQFLEVSLNFCCNLSNCFVKKKKKKKNKKYCESVCSSRICFLSKNKMKSSFNKNNSFLQDPKMFFLEKRKLFFHISIQKANSEKFSYYYPISYLYLFQTILRKRTIGNFLFYGDFLSQYSAINLSGRVIGIELQHFVKTVQNYLKSEPFPRKCSQCDVLSPSKFSEFNRFSCHKENCYNFNKNFAQHNELYSKTNGIQSTQSILQTSFKITLQCAKPILFSPCGFLHKTHGDFVEANSPILTLLYKKLMTGDIVQGIPKIEELLEARRTKEGQLFRNNMHARLDLIFNLFRKELSSEQAVQKSLERIQQILVNEVQYIYQSQGISVSDKHFEIIVSQMTSKVRIANSRNTGLLRGELIHLKMIQKINFALFMLSQLGQSSRSFKMEKKMKEKRAKRAGKGTWWKSPNLAVDLSQKRKKKNLTGRRPQHQINLKPNETQLNLNIPQLMFIQKKEKKKIAKKDMCGSFTHIRPTTPPGVFDDVTSSMIKNKVNKQLILKTFQLNSNIFKFQSKNYFYKKNLKILWSRIEPSILIKTQNIVNKKISFFNNPLIDRIQNQQNSIKDNELIKQNIKNIKKDRKSTRLNSSHEIPSRMPSSA